MIVVCFKRPKGKQNVFNLRRYLAQRDDQSVNYKLCEFEIKASFLLSILAC